MKTRVAATLGAALALAVSAGGPAAAAELELAPAGKPRFPVRAFALTLPSKMSLGSGQVTVRENGETIPHVRVVSGSATDQLGVVLVIDASNSMSGEAIAGATDAARTLADHRNQNQPLGIVTFNDTAEALLNPTTDETEINSALSSPPALARGTHIYDAVDVAIDQLEEEGISKGSVVVLSDGADTGSSESVDDVAAAARQAGVRLYAVGLRSSAYDPGPLQQLAAGGRDVLRGELPGGAARDLPPARGGAREPVPGPLPLAGRPRTAGRRGGPGRRSARSRHGAVHDAGPRGRWSAYVPTRVRGRLLAVEGDRRGGEPDRRTSPRARARPAVPAEQPIARAA
jgi:hypothetical protein